MSKSEMLNPDGTVSMPEALIKRWGMTMAGVYGYMQRCARQQDGVCSQSMSEIGAALHLHRVTVSRYVNMLESAGLVRDLTPWRSNEPHSYQALEIGPGAPLEPALPGTAQSIWRALRPFLERQSGREMTRYFYQWVFPHKWDGHTLVLRLVNPYQLNLCLNKLHPAAEAQLQKFVPEAVVRLEIRPGVNGQD